MKDEYKTLFGSIGEIKAPERLEGVVLVRIHQAEKIATRIQFFVFSTTILVISVLAIPVLNYVFNGFYQSGFYQYLSLLFSDADTILAHSADFLILLGESIPLYSFIVLLTFVLFAVVSIKTVFLYSRKFNYQFV